MIVARKISKVYPTGAKALTGVSCAIRQGEFVFLVGPNGAGKSTLLKLLLRSETATSGCLLVNGIDVSCLNHDRLNQHRRQLGVVFQDPRLLPKKTIFENVALPLEADGTDRNTIRRLVPRALRLAGLEDHGSSFPDQLSGGQQQQAAIARALSVDPGIILADEPTGNLSPSAADRVMQLLSAINERGITVVLATHSRDTVDTMRRRVMALHHGYLVSDSPHGCYPDVLVASAA